MYTIHVYDKVRYKAVGSKSFIRDKLIGSQHISKVNEDKLSLFLGTLIWAGVLQRK